MKALSIALILIVAAPVIAQDGKKVQPPQVKLMLVWDTVLGWYPTGDRNDRSVVTGSIPVTKKDSKDAAQEGKKAGDKKQPAKAPPHYLKLEVCGELRIGGREEDWLSGELLEALGKQVVNANVVVHSIGMGLIFGENKELAALAKTLDGKTVVITGHLRRFSPMTAVRPTRFVDYIQVTSMKAAE